MSKIRGEKSPPGPNDPKSYINKKVTEVHWCTKCYHWRVHSTQQHDEWIQDKELFYKKIGFVKNVHWEKPKDNAPNSSTPMAAVSATKNPNMETINEESEGESTPQPPVKQSLSRISGGWIAELNEIPPEKNEKKRRNLRKKNLM